ncbi:MAG: hypothetical protein QQN63_03080 [Nitrosopumilus sp.]
MVRAENRATTKSFILITVPHTGTRFVRRFLRSILQAEYLAKGTMLYTKRGRTTVPTFAHIHPIQGYNASIVDNTKHLPLVTTLRHPYMHFLTTWDALIISRGEKRVKAYSEAAWYNMIQIFPKYARTMVIPIDKQMPEEERVTLLYKLARFVGSDRLDTETCTQLVEYAHAWHPEGTRGGYAIKTKYLENGNMPCDMGFLDFAVSWYYEQLEIYTESLYGTPPGSGD